MDPVDTPPPPPPPSSDIPPVFDLRGAEDVRLAHPPPPAPNRHRLNPHPVPRALHPAVAAWEAGESEHSGSDHYDSEGEEQQRVWEPITEDVTVPCSDELEFLVSKGEHSALDHEYWEKEAFFDVDDPELVPGESGRIDWLVEGFNGTEDKPNNETLMRSQVVRIGGLDWQIKFYPKGNGSQYLSVYIECITMLEPDYAETEDFSHPPFPFLKGGNQVRKRRSIAAQLSVVMYNPDEPRVYEHQSEAHQFHKKQADYGWVYFSRHPRNSFHIRQHTQRQAILRNDRLAFKAYIRLIDDPTGSMWEHSGGGREETAEEIISTTGLRPFKKSLQYTAVAVPLLHFAPFRKLVQELPAETQLARWLQPLLLKMFTRRQSPAYKYRGMNREGDVMEMMWKICTTFHSENDSALAQQWKSVVGEFDSEKGMACGANRLNTKDYASIQEAVDQHTKSIACPQLLTLELTRQEHDKKTRKWKKLTNDVRVDDHIQVNGSGYTLFAFITHCGHLMSSRYNSYVRPNGIGKGWYLYQNGGVTRLTEKQGRECHSGEDAEGVGSSNSGETVKTGHDSPFSEINEPQSEVSSVVMYVRDDVAAETFEAPTVETWDPESLRPTLLLTSLPKSGIAKNEAELMDPPLSAIREQVEDRPAFDDGQLGAVPEQSEESRLEVLIARAADVTTPEPDGMAGEDTIMRDADEELTNSVEMLDTGSDRDTNLEKGTFSWLGRCHYEGQWKDGKYHGGGYHIDTNGDEYLGKFENGLKHGFGKMIYAATGDIYEGEWSQDKHHGQGRLTELSSGNVFEGGWLKGRKHGPFVLKGTVTEEEKSCCTICYDQEMTTAFYDCGHVVACRDCANRITICPVCRRDVHARLQLYGVKLVTG